MNPLCVLIIMASLALRASAVGIGGARSLPAPVRGRNGCRPATSARAVSAAQIDIDAPLAQARLYGFGSLAAYRKLQVQRRLLQTTRAYTLDKKGDSNSLEYRVFFKVGDDVVSPWHDIPLFSGNGTYNFVAEIPKNTSAKFEAATDEPRTPIKQDVKKGKLRFYPYNIDWNYGFLPQTWEDPSHKNSDTGALGDNDPVDVVEIGSAAAESGGVYKVKVLGAYAMIDEGELDWKVVAIRTDDPKADLVNDVEDVEREFPGELQKILEWFRDYKIPDGKPANKFGFDDKALNKEFTTSIIKETHDFWLKFKDGQTDGDGLSLF